MSTDFEPQDEPTILRDRSPRPYFAQDWAVPHRTAPFASLPGGSTPQTSSFESDGVPGSRRSSAPENGGSDSGTEADDERHRYLALPPASVISRKGLKHSDGSTSPVITPSQLDWQGQRFLGPHHTDSKRGRKLKHGDLDHLEEERKKFASRRRAERIRRVSEGALLAAIGVVVIYGSRVWDISWQWYLVQVLSQVSAIAGLVAFYPLRLVSVEHDRGHLHIWSRFWIPPSFDPATILYPTFLPVLVALCLVRQLPQLFLTNTILGLASLPPRLFPAWARSADINTLHWMVSIVPLISSRAFGLMARKFPAYMSSFAIADVANLVPAEWLLLLYPLHQAMLPALHYLTTSSLLPTEKHLLSTALINLLMFAGTPQMVILRSVLWIGGVLALASCTHILRWNIILARVPTWRLRDLRRSHHSPAILTQLMEEVFDVLISLQRRVFRSKMHTTTDSGDEDEPVPFVKAHKARSPSLMTTATFHEPLGRNKTIDSDHGPPKPNEAERNDSKTRLSQRRNTISSPMEASIDRGSLTAQSVRHQARRNRDWVMKLTPFKATLRKRVYASYVYATVLAIILLPVRHEVAKHALSGAEPIFWAVDYLFGGLPSLTVIFDYVHTHKFTTILSDGISVLASTSSIPLLRSEIGEANTRLVLIVCYALVLLIGLTAVLILTPTIEVDTRRKIFHAIMVGMFLPTIFVDPCFCALALSLVLAIFLILEVIRAGQVPPLGTAIGRFVAPYVDGRDLRGPMVVSHVFLLIGCAIPFWLSCAAFPRDEAGWDISFDARETAMVAGVICVGMGDAAASLIGRRYGRRKWPWIGGKSLEGSAAFALAVTVGLSTAKAWLKLGGWKDVNASEHGVMTESLVLLVKAWIAGCGASFMEAVLTGANDNVVVPLALWLLCRGLRL